MNAPRSPFVNALGWVSFALAALGVVSGLMQAAMLPALQPESLLQALGDGGMALPPALRWTFEHLQLLNGASTLLSALFAWVSWDLLRRREWARRAFIAFLVLGAAGGFAGAALCLHALDWAAAQNPMDAGELDPLFASLQSATRVVAIGSASLVALLHAAIVWKLCAPAIRAEFSGGEGSA
ncbi:membrane protein [Pseudoxanthomonas sangjuensis]|uniref:hypothetical protein n=1 Tax=Pseudoxanthomonas sangjuensis TaxID=1503750 RepID=UPI001390F9D4|nr:hypothetical protein [Pseudoxanthomonas sangjuensis]KAF1708508.1 hypothetical protein CSC71_11640 [Pseudoxanthomonas sangjuensis]